MLLPPSLSYWLWSYSGLFFLIIKQDTEVMLLTWVPHILVLGTSSYTSSPFLLRSSFCLLLPKANTFKSFGVPQYGPGSCVPNKGSEKKTESSRCPGALKWPLHLLHFKVTPFTQHCPSLSVFPWASSVISLSLLSEALLSKLCCISPSSSGLAISWQ